MGQIPGTGFFVIYNHIPELMAAVESTSRAGVKRKADAILRDARSRINRDTGELQDTAYTTSEELGKVAEIVFPAQHATSVEFGTWKMSARPYLGPAMEAGANDFFTTLFHEVFTND